MSKTVFWQFRKSLGLIKRRNDFFSADEILLMDIASILRWSGCGSGVLKNFCQFWGNPQAPASLKDRLERFLENYQVSLAGLWQSLPTEIKAIEPAKFFQQLIGSDNVQAE